MSPRLTAAAQSAGTATGGGGGGAGGEAAAPRTSAKGLCARDSVKESPLLQTLAGQDLENFNDLIAGLQTVSDQNDAKLSILKDAQTLFLQTESFLQQYPGEEEYRNARA